MKQTAVEWLAEKLIHAEPNILEWHKYITQAKEIEKEQTINAHKAYQVFKGEQDKHCHQRYDLVATYLDKEKALVHCKQIAESTPLYGDVLEEGEFYGEGKYKSWDAIGWDRVTIAKFKEIDITK